MALETGTIRKLAEQLEDAELQAYDVTMITADYPDMDWDDAYAIQDEIRRRKEARGSKITGLKAGLTSFAKMKQMGVETPVFGFVADYMGKPDGGEIKTSELIHPKVEAEICIVTKSDLEGPGAPSPRSWRPPTSCCRPSRSSTRATGTSSSTSRASSPTTPPHPASSSAAEPAASAELDLRTLGVVLEKNGEIVATATAAAVLGNPLAAVAMMANHLTARGQLIPAGTFIMTGGVTEAIPRPGRRPHRGPLP